MKIYPKKIVLASSNDGKLEEIRALSDLLDVEFVSQKNYGVSSVEETGLTFIENAILKARHASKISGLPSLADDSGIEVDILNGKPGVFSAIYSGNNATDIQNNNKLLQKLKGIPKEKRTARYNCCLVLMSHENDPTPKIFSATWEGVILTEPKGVNGFGYDPLFFVPSQGFSAAELTRKVKNYISHRGKAMTELITYLNSIKQ